MAQDDRRTSDGFATGAGPGAAPDGSGPDGSGPDRAAGSDAPHAVAGGPPVSALELAEAVEAVRHGLLAGAARAAGSRVRFEVGEIRMEFGVQLQRSRSGRGGVKVWVVDAGADAARSTGRTHTVSFTLRAVDTTTGGPVLIAAPDEGGMPDEGDVPDEGRVPDEGGVPDGR